MNTPPVLNVWLHLAEVSKIAEPFSNSSYDVTGGLALAEQLMLITSPWHALLPDADVWNCTFSGLTVKKRLKGGIHGSAHVSVLSRAYCFLTNQWRVDFRGKFAFVNRGYAVVTVVFRVIDFFAFDSEISSLWKRNVSGRYCHRKLQV